MSFITGRCNREAESNIICMGRNEKRSVAADVCVRTAEQVLKKVLQRKEYFLGRRIQLHLDVIDEYI